MLRLSMIAVLAALAFVIALASPTRPAEASWGSTLSSGCGENCASPQEVCTFWGQFYKGGCLGITGPLYGTGTKPGKIIGWKFQVLYTAGGGIVIDSAAYARCIAPLVVDALSPTGCSEFVSPPLKKLGEPPCNTGCADFVGNPVNVVIGNKYQSVVDYASAGPDVLAFTRTYNSQGQFMSLIGGGWQSNFDRSVILGGTSPSTATVVMVIRPDGRQFKFTKSNGVWSKADTDIDGTLTTDSSTIWTFVDADDTVETFDYTTGRLQSITTRSGYSQTLQYDTNGALQAITDSFNRGLSFTMADGLVQTMTDPDGKVYTYAYDAVVVTHPVRLISVTYPGSTAPTTQYLYENATYPFALTGILDEKGNRFASWTYDSKLRVIASEHAGGAEATTLSYNLSSSLGTGTVTATNALGRQATFTLATAASTARVTRIDEAASANAAATTTTTTYDSRGYVSSRTDAKGNRTNFTNDSRGLVLSQTEAVGKPEARTRTITWHASFRVLTSIVETGRTTDFTYDGQGRLLTRTETDTGASIHAGRSRTWTYTYTAQGLPATVDGPRTDVSDVTSYGYDATGTLVTVTNALGQVAQVTSHDASGRPLTIIDANNVLTDLAYDDRGRLTQRTVHTGQGNAVTNFGYDATGLLTTLGLPSGLQLTYGYDDAHRRTSVSNQLGEHIDYTLDALGNVTHEAVKSSTGTIVRMQSQAFDELGRLISAIGANNQVTAFGYDANGNRISVVDPLSHITIQAFDSLNRLITVTDHLGGIAQTGWDTDDRMVSATDQRGLVTTTLRDGFGDVLSRTSPDTGTTSFETDLAGNVTSRTDARGVVTNYAYDALDRLTARTYPANPAENVVFGYDDTAAGNKGVGRLTSATDATGSTTLGYDEQGRVVRQTRTLAGLGATTLFTWDLGGNLSGLTYPSGRIVTYARDGLGRVSSITTQADAGAPVVTVLSNVGWQAFGASTGWTHGNGLVRSVDLDQDGLPTDITTQGSVTVQDLGYSWDAAGNVAAIADRHAPSHSQSFGHDALARLIHAEGLYGSIDYGWDAVGNRLSRSIVSGGGGQVDHATYGATSNRLLSVATGGTTRSLVTSASGNIIQDDNGTGTVLGLGYDQSDRLVSLTRNGLAAASYAHDGFGRRVSKTLAGATTTHFTWGLDGEVLAESNDQGQPLTEIIRLDGQPVAVVSGGALAQIHTDHLGTPQAATDATSAVTWSRAFRPFGEETVATGTLVLNLRFPGQWLDAESGYRYNVFRDYDPSTGRYIQSDPIGLRGGWNTYAYVQGDPLRRVDPLGLADIPTPDKIPGGPYTPAGPGQQPGTYYGPSQQSGPKTVCRWVPSEDNGGPPGSQGYWKTKGSGQQGWNRYDQSGNPLTPDEAHPNPLRPNPLPPYIRYGGATGAFLGTLLYSRPAY